MPFRSCACLISRINWLERDRNGVIWFGTKRRLFSVRNNKAVYGVSYLRNEDPLISLVQRVPGMPFCPTANTDAQFVTRTLVQVDLNQPLGGRVVSNEQLDQRHVGDKSGDCVLVSGMAHVLTADLQ